MISFRHLKIKSSRVRIIIPKILEKFKSLSKRVDIADKKVYNIRINFMENIMKTVTIATAP